MNYLRPPHFHRKRFKIVHLHLFIICIKGVAKDNNRIFKFMVL